jgi:hypothetical protein
MTPFIVMKLMSFNDVLIIYTIIISPSADVIADGESLAELLIEAGVAVRYDDGKKTHRWCE